MPLMSSSGSSQGSGEAGLSLAQPPKLPDSCSVFLVRGLSLKIIGVFLCLIWIGAYWQCWCDRVTLGSWELYVIVMSVLQEPAVEAGVYCY